MTAAGKGARRGHQMCIRDRDDGGGGHVAGLQRVHEGFALGVDEHGTHGTHLFRDQRAVDLQRIGRAGGMVLEGVGVKERHARAIAELSLIHI